MSAGEALDRFIARRLKLAWRDARGAIQHGRVTVDGVACKRYRRALTVEDMVAVDGAVVADAPDDGVLICHKPAGVACSHAPQDEPLIYGLVPAAYAHPDLQTAGRLDRDTTGLIVLTIDGALIQALTDPRVDRWKRYRLRLTAPLPTDAVERVAAGLALLDDPRPCLPARLTLGPTAIEATLELREGRPWQVKRMMLALGVRIVALHRDRVGVLALPDDLAPGVMRPATPAERAEMALLPDRRPAAG